MTRKGLSVGQSVRMAPGLEERLGRGGGLKASVKRSQGVGDGRCKGMGALAGREKVSLP